DYGDKAGFKAMAGALKYAILQTLCVPTEETRGKQDPESDPSVDEGGAAPKRTTKRTTKKTDGGTPPPATNGGPPADGKGKEILDLIAGCRSEGDLEGVKAQVRAYAEALRAKGDTSYKVIVDEYQAKKAEVGA